MADLLPDSSHRDFTVLQSLRDKAERFIRKIRVRRCAVPFIVCFRERSGSTHLCSLLDNHPEIVCRQEDFCERIVSPGEEKAGEDLFDFGQLKCHRNLLPFHQKRIYSPSRKMIVQHFHDIYSGQVRACGFKFKFPIQFQLFPEVLAELNMILPDVRIISLQRRNTLKQAISRENMLRIRAAIGGKSSNLVEQHMPSEFDSTFEIDVDSVLRYARQLKTQEASFLEAVGELEEKSAWPVLSLEYEALLADQQAVVRSVFEFLGVDVSATLYSTVHKATPDDLASAITNFDELKRAVAGTEFESMI